MPNLTASLDFQARALTLRSDRQRLLASNIANADTPGYVSRDLDFKSALQAASGGSGGSGAGVLASTQSRHITSASGGAGGGGAGGSATMNYVVNSQNSIDQNTVDMDRERAAFADNTIKYEATLRFLGGDVKNMLDAIKGGQ